VGISRYRSVEQMPAPPVAETPEAGVIAACEQSRVAAQLGRTAVLPRGVRRFRSVQEADADRRDREIAAMRSVAEARRA
jgi:hypothetical protein